MAVGNQSSNGAIIADINITPLTDVMLVLLIIFMVTATFFVTEPAMEVVLPPAVSSDLVTKEDGEITVIVYNVFIIWQGRTVRRAEIVASEMLNLVAPEA